MAKSKRLILTILITVVALSFSVLPSFAAVSSFRFTSTNFRANRDGYDYWAIYQYSNWYYLAYFNGTDVSNMSLEKWDNTNTHILGLPDGLPYLRFANATKAFTYAAFDTAKCDASGLIDKEMSSESNTADWLVKSTGVMMTNCSAFAEMWLDFGLSIDSGYHIYFNNADTKEYVICAVLVDDTNRIKCVISESVPTFDADTNVLTCSSDMYIFDFEDLQAAKDFIMYMDPDVVGGVYNAKSLNNVSKFYYSSYNIIDLNTNAVIHYATDPDGTTQDPIGSGVLTPENEDDLNSFFDSIISFFLGIDSWFDSWLPENYATPILVGIGTLSGLMILLFAIKVLPFV